MTRKPATKAVTQARSPGGGTKEELPFRTIRARQIVEEGYRLLNAAACGEAQPEDALRMFQQAVRLDSDLGAAHMWRGYALHYLLSRHTEALEAFRQAVDLNPNLGAAQLGRGLALAALGDARGALGAYKEALEVTAEDARALRTPLIFRWHRTSVRRAAGVRASGRTARSEAAAGIRSCLA